MNGKAASFFQQADKNFNGFYDVLRWQQVSSRPATLVSIAAVHGTSAVNPHLKPLFWMGSRNYF